MGQEHQARFAQFSRNRQPLLRAERYGIKCMLQIHFRARAVQNGYTAGIEFGNQTIALPSRP